MLTHLKQSILATLVLTLLCGLAYPLAMTGLAQALFPHQAHGSLIEADGKVVGSALIGQAFARPDYFLGRPSATTDSDPNDAGKTVPAPYNAAGSNASNAAPTSKSLVADVGDRVAALRAENPNARIPVPVDLVTASGSGLDPHISPNAALYQLPRVAAARHVGEGDLKTLVDLETERPTAGILGEARVNVLKLNLALDKRFPTRQ
ncbi:MAG TPA: potassium-transporting ATPase subunit KdpC [Rhodospirillaceae bacterium]|nr:potassium-transporting ATPase subunit KdpC [Rhodospirillaceae bacterium]